MGVVVLTSEVSMKEKKISPREFHERMKAACKHPRKRRPSFEWGKVSPFVEFNSYLASTRSDGSVGYAALASKELQDVVMPESVARKYREYHFEE